MKNITIITKGEAEIRIVANQPGQLIELAAGEVIAPGIDHTSQAALGGHTKVLPDGTRVSSGDTRTDHVAVIDHATGLMWAVKSIGDSDGDPMSQADCEKACGELRLLGHDDWRLPTRAELAALVDDTRHEPSIDTNLFPGVLPRWHWTSTAAAWSSASAWGVYFGDGNVDSLHRDLSGFALAVRRAGQ